MAFKMQILLPFFIFALGGALIGSLLAIASEYYKVKTNPVVEALTETLPGANCGGCGFAGCSGLATAISKGEAQTTACTAGGVETARRVAKIMGVDFTGYKNNKAFVKCSGCADITAKKYLYVGSDDCVSASKLGGGEKECTYSCLGFGSCVKECRFDAIKIVDGIAKIDREKCTGCGRCAVICPKKVIDMIPENSTYAVTCSSKDKPAFVKAVCEVGCVGCRICVKKCKSDAIDFENNLAIINQEKCVSCGICEKVCPRKIIYNLPVTYKN